MDVRLCSQARCTVILVHFEGTGKTIASRLGKALRVPIYVRDRVVDLRCCVHDKLYRAPLVLRNRGKVALKVQTHVPKKLQEADVLGFFPPMGYVQGEVDGKDGEFVIQMKFRPRRHLGEDPEGLIVPIEVLVPDQTLPVIFRLRARLTSSDVVFDPPSIDFGPCFTGQSSRFPSASRTLAHSPSALDSCSFLVS